MAYIEMKSGVKRSVSREVGERLWKSLKNPEGLDDKQLDYLANVGAIWLNWHEAPDDFIKENLAWVIPMALGDWIVDHRGRPVKPGTDSAWKFAKRWGLWEMGQPTRLVLTAGRAIATQPPVAGSLPVNDR